MRTGLDDALAITAVRGFKKIINQSKDDKEDGGESIIAETRNAPNKYHTRI